MVSYEGAGQRLCSPALAHVARQSLPRRHLLSCHPPVSYTQLCPASPSVPPCRSMYHPGHMAQPPSGWGGGLFIPAAARVGPGSRVETGILCLL